VQLIAWEDLTVGLCMCDYKSTFYSYDSCHSGQHRQLLTGYPWLKWTGTLCFLSSRAPRKCLVPFRGPQYY